MKLISTSVLATAIVLGFGSWHAAAAQKQKNAAQRAKSQDPTAAILKLEGEIMKAIRLKDAAPLGRILSDDFVMRTPGQPELGKAAFIKAITSIPVTVVDVRGDEFGISIYGNVAILTGIQRVVTKDGAGAPETSAGAFTDVFVKRAGRWWLTMAHGVDLPAGSR
jgi:ketosteroid isomerase-like protein